jgi:hypothetical protein
VNANKILKHIDSAMRGRGMHVVEYADDKRATFWQGMASNISRVTVGGKELIRRGN